MKEAIREYRRELALFALVNAPKAFTAADLCEQMQSYAEAELHPRALWENLNGNDVAGALRTLEKGGAVIQEGEEATRAGRSAPTWRHALSGDDAAAVSIPEPPGSRRGEVMAEPASPYDSLSRAQIYAMLEAGDIAMEELARLQQQGISIIQQSLQANSRIRRILADAGVLERQ